MAYIDLTRSTIIKRLAKAAELNQRSPLGSEEITEALNRTNAESPLELCDALIGEGILFRSGENRFTPRSRAFSGGRVLIKPTEEELERGILIPGHRFLPLYDTSIHPSQLDLRVNGKKLRKTMISHTIQGLGIYHSLFGTQELIGLIESVDLSILKEIQETAFECADVLHILNSSSESLDDQTKAALEERYRTLLQSFYTKAEIAHEQSMEEKFAARREERLQSVSAAEYMILDVTIEDLKPPVSRTLRVPETMTLSDLHYILQLSFGWEDNHLHSFYIGSTEYTDMETCEQEFIDEDQARDEESVQISEIPEVGEKLLYVYDFGDDWRHEISLRHVIPASMVPKDERENAVCLDAQGAGPPEDCGGLPGYQKLVQAVTTPASQRTSEQEEFVYWAGNWSPGNFSLDEINSLLAKL